MNQAVLSSFIWSVADLLRGNYKPHEYGRFILPFTVLRRLDCVRGFTVVDVASRIGIPKHTLYGWVQAAKKTVPASGAAVAPRQGADRALAANEQRPHSAHGYKPPATVRRNWSEPDTIHPGLTA